MKPKRERWIMKNVALLFGILLALGSGDANAAKYKIRWNVAHNPGTPEVLKPVEEFAAQMKAQTNGEVEVEIQHFTRNAESTVNLHEVALDNVYRGETEMSQVAVSILERFAPEMSVLDLPFLFRDHAHTAKALDGAPGKRLMKLLAEGSNEKVRGLGFTYSGGYRQVYSSREINRLEDFAGLKMYEPNHRVGIEFFDLLGVKYVGGPSGSSKDTLVKAFSEGTVEAEEGEYNRVAPVNEALRSSYNRPRVLNETNHSMFLTAVVINEKFFRSLPAKYQTILQVEAEKMAIAERAVSIDLVDVSRDNLQKNGAKFAKLSETEQKRLVEAAKPLYKRYQGRYGSLITQIRALK